MNINKSARAGIALLELLIALTIIAFIASTVLNQLSVLQGGRERKKFIQSFEGIVQTAWQQAILTQTVHRVVCNIKDRTAHIEIELPESTAAKPVFGPTKHASSRIEWPDAIEIRQFFIEGYDEMKRFTGRKTESIWFYIIPNGMVQATTINFIDKSQLVDGKPKPTGLLLNPFTAQCKVYHEFQK